MSEATLAHLKLSEIHPDPEQPRKDFDAEGEGAFLVESVKQHGVIQPIVVRPNEKGYVIVSGERRYRAAQEAKLKTIPAMVRTNGDNPLAVATVENVVRKDLNPVEEGHAYARLLTTTDSDEEKLAKLVNRPVERVRDRIKLTLLNDEAQAKIIDGTLTLDAANTLADLHAISPAVASVLAWGAGRLYNAHAVVHDTGRCLHQLQREDGTIICPDCEGSGYVWDGDEEHDDEPCKKCKETGRLKGDGERAPAFLLIGAMLDEGDIASFGAVNADIGKKVSTAWKAWAAARDAAMKAQGGYGYVEQPRLTTEAFDAANAYGCLIELSSHQRYITDAEFAAEYVIDTLARAAEAASKPKKGASSTKAEKGGSGTLTAAQKQEKQQRAKEREAAKKAVVKGRAFNLDLGAALATKCSEPKITTEAMKLLVGQLIENQVEETGGYGGGKVSIRNAGLFNYLRFTHEQPLDKKGRPVYPRGPEAHEQAVKEARAMLKAAKTPEQVLGVAVRLFGTAAFTDVRGLPKVDVVDCYDHDHLDFNGWRAYVGKLLPKAIRDRAHKRTDFRWSS